MSVVFPEADFRAFYTAAVKHFPGPVSDECLWDPNERRQQFDRAWQAVRYRHRLCVECSEEFSRALATGSAAWHAGLRDEEVDYTLERCIYVFFTSSLSLFESFGFCLYFLGNAAQPSAFPHIVDPRKITLEKTRKAFVKVFPQEGATQELVQLSQRPEYGEIDEVRNILGHRLLGTRSIHSIGMTQSDGTHTEDRQETWYIPGCSRKLSLNDSMLFDRLKNLTDLFTRLALAARSFAEALP